MSAGMRIEWTEFLRTSCHQGKSDARKLSASASDRAMNGRLACSVVGERVPQRLGVVGRKRELNVLALFGVRSEWTDGEVEEELSAGSAADRKRPGDESRFAIDRRGWPS